MKSISLVAAVLLLLADITRAGSFHDCYLADCAIAAVDKFGGCWSKESCFCPNTTIIDYVQSCVRANCTLADQQDVFDWYIGDCKSAGYAVAFVAGTVSGSSTIVTTMSTTSNAASSAAATTTSVPASSTESPNPSGSAPSLSAGISASRTAPSTTPTSPATETANPARSSKTIGIGVGVGVIGIALLGVAAFYIRRRRRHSSLSDEKQHGQPIYSSEGVQSQSQNQAHTEPQSTKPQCFPHAYERPMKTYPEPSRNR